MPADVMTLNARLDALPRARVRVGARVLPVYLVAGGVGVAVGAVVHVGLALVMRRSVAVAVAVAALACATFVVFTVVRGWVTRTQKIVLLEHLFVVEAATAGALTLAKLPALPYLDTLTAGLAAFLAVGRIGCFLCGCCFGVASPIGVRYPPECGPACTARRLPVQLVESFAWATFAVVDVACVLAAAPGTALVFTFGAYAVVRLALEPLRGDVRARLLGLTEAGWLSLAALVGAVVLHDRFAQTPPRIVLACLGFSALAALVLVLARRGWLHFDFDPSSRTRVDAAAREMRALELEPTPVVRRAGDWVLAASMRRRDGRDELSLSVSSATHAIDRAEASLVLEWLVEGLGVHAHGVEAIAVRPGMFMATFVSSPRGVSRERAA